MNKTLELTVFAVPNSINSFNDWHCKTYIPYQKDYLHNLGIEVKDDDPLLQVWMISNDPERNHNDHGFNREQLKKLGLPEDAEGTNHYHDAIGRIRAPEMLPLHVWKDAKEGEVRTFTAPNGCIVKLTFAQKAGRYASFGNFEDITGDLLFNYKIRKAG